MVQLQELYKRIEALEEYITVLEEENDSLAEQVDAAVSAHIHWESEATRYKQLYEEMVEDVRKAKSGT